jgi:hypothetical protein
MVFLLSLPNKVEFLLHILFLWLIPLLMGYGIASLLLPKNLKKYMIWLSYWFGIITIIIFLVLAGFSDISVQKISWWLLFIFFALTCYSLRKDRLVISFRKNDILLLLFSLITLGFNLLPLARKGLLSTTVSMGNLDIVTYSTASNYLLTHPLDKTIIIKNAPQALYLLNGDYRWGPPLLLSFFSSIINVQIYQLSYLLPVVIFSLTIPLVCCFFEQIFKARGLGIISVFIFTAFNSNLLYILYHVFFGQILFWGLSTSLFILLFDYFETNNKPASQLTINEVLISANLIAIYFSFHEALVFIFAILFIYGIYRLTQDNNKSYLNSFIRIGFLIIIFAVSSFIHNVLFIQETLTTPPEPENAIGWAPFRTPNPFASPLEIFGIRSVHTNSALPVSISIVSGVAFLIIMLLGLKTIKKKMLLLSSLILYIFSFVYYGLIHPHYFLYNRVITFALPILIVLLVGGVNHLIIKKRIFIIPLVICLMLSIYTARKLNNRFLHEMIYVNKNIISLDQFPQSWVDKIVQDRDILFVNLIGSTWDRMWALYFLKTNILFHIGDNWPQIYEKMEGKLALFPKSNDRYLNELYQDSIVWENNYFFLAPFCNSDGCLVTNHKNLTGVKFGNSLTEDFVAGNGWSVKEESGRWADSTESAIRLTSPSKTYRFLSFTAKTLQQPQKASVYLNNQLLDKVELSTDWVDYSVALPKEYQAGIYTITFKFSNIYQPNQLGISPDARNLAAHFKEIKLQP